MFTSEGNDIAKNTFANLKLLARKKFTPNRDSILERRNGRKIEEKKIRELKLQDIVFRSKEIRRLKQDKKIQKFSEEVEIFKKAK